MKFSKLIIKRAAQTVIAGLCFMLFIAPARAQKKDDAAKKVPIEILSAAVLQHVLTDSGEINKLIDSVVMKQGDNMMYCDSAYFDLAKNNVEAFGDVRIVQPGSEANSDYMRYVGNTKMAYMRGNVMLTDGKSHLWSEEVEYNTGTKIGTYAQGGTLQDSTTTLSSNAGTYDMNSKNARFTGEVYVTDPKYNIISDDLGYNTESKLVTFFAPSVVTSDSSILRTSCGTYDSKNEVAHFTCRSSILNKEQYVEADKIDHNRRTGIGMATGNVIAIDTAQHSTLYCGRADFNEKKKTTLASIKPVLKQMNGKDSLFIRADTFFTAPIPMKGDTLQPVKKTVGKGKKKKEILVPAEDTTEADSSRPRFVIGYHHVLIFSDSMQGKCDSISYIQKDSVLKMMYDPVMWSRKSQITGDTILLYMDSSKLKRMYVPNNGLMVQQSGPEKAKIWDQVQGKTITGLFKNNALDSMVIEPEAQTIYYSKDDDGAYMGVNEASGERMTILFKNEAMDKILFIKDTKQKVTPMDKANLPAMKLSRFKWREDERPKSLEELFK